MDQETTFFKNTSHSRKVSMLVEKHVLASMFVDCLKYQSPIHVEYKRVLLVWLFRYTLHKGAHSTLMGSNDNIVKRGVENIHIKSNCLFWHVGMIRIMLKSWWYDVRIMLKNHCVEIKNHAERSVKSLHRTGITIEGIRNEIVLVLDICIFFF